MNAGPRNFLLARLAKTELLVIDDWGLEPLTAPKRHRRVPERLGRLRRAARRAPVGLARRGPGG